MKLNAKKTVYVGFAFLIIVMFWQVYDSIIAKMLINSFGFNQTASGVVLALDNVLALFLLPLFGVWSDRTKTKYGKRTPYIVIGVLIAALLFIGVAIADSQQQIALKQANVAEVVEIIENDEVIGYDYDGEEFYPESDAVFGDLQKAKNRANEARRADVWIVARDHINYLIIFLGILLLVLVAMASFRSPAVSLMPDVTPKPLRSKANAIINLMGTAGGMIALGFMSFLAKDNEPYIITFIVLAILMYIFLALFLWKVKEPKVVEEMHKTQVEYGLEDENVVKDVKEEKMSPEVLRSFILILVSIVFWFMAYNAATSKFSIYAGEVLKMGFSLPLLVAQAVAVIAYIPIGMLSSKFGRKKMIIVGIVILTTAFILGTAATEKTKILIFFTMGIAGIGWATINVNSYPMIVEMSRGGNVGKYTGYYYTASMFAQIITPILSGAAMDYLLGYYEPRLLFPYSVIFCILALITMSFVRHGDSKPIPTKKLEAFADPNEILD